MEKLKLKSYLGYVPFRDFSNDQSICQLFWEPSYCYPKLYWSFSSGSVYNNQKSHRDFKVQQISINIENVVSEFSIWKAENRIRRRWQEHIQQISYTETKNITSNRPNSREKEAQPNTLDNEY